LLTILARISGQSGTDRKAGPAALRRQPGRRARVVRRNWASFALAVALTSLSGLIPFVSSAAAAMALICAAVLGI